MSSEDLDMLAAEHALGLLDGPELERARGLEASDPAFAAAVAAWTARVAPLLDQVAPVTPPAALWDAIAGRLDTERRDSGQPEPRDNVVQLRRQLGRWRVLAGGASALAASLALALALRPGSTYAPPAASAPMVASIADPAGRETRMVADWNPAQRQLVLVATGTLTADPAHSHELWAIAPGGKPRSLGVLAAGPTLRLTLTPELAQALRAGATLAISLEPAGGSPSGSPTGPVIAAGQLAST